MKGRRVTELSGVGTAMTTEGDGEWRGTGRRAATKGSRPVGILRTATLLAKAHHHGLVVTRQETNRYVALRLINLTDYGKTLNLRRKTNKSSVLKAL